MTDCTMVKGSAGQDCISLRTVSRRHKSPHNFYVTYNELLDLDGKPSIVTRDINSYAEFRKCPDGTLEIRFTWLTGDGGNLKGYTETVTVDSDGLMDFVRRGRATGSGSWAALSVERDRMPRMDFTSDGARRTLRTVLGTPCLRRKLSKALRDNFHWPKAERIRFCGDWDKYNFGFTEYLAGLPDAAGISGGLILHRENGLANAKYAIHT